MPPHPRQQRRQHIINREWRWGHGKIHVEGREDAEKKYKRVTRGAISAFKKVL
jgi:hypothetical protein